MSRRPSFRPILRGIPVLPALALALLVGGCGSLGDRARGPGGEKAPAADARVPADLPAPPGTAADTAPLPWSAFVRDDRVRALVSRALAANRDLRVAVLAVQRAQAQFAATDANRLPTVGVGLGAQRAPNSQGREANTLTAGVQLASWEVDLFGRLQDLSDAARAQWLASEAGRRAAELSLAAQVVQTALAWQADSEALAIAGRTLASRDATLKLTALREQAGAASLLELQTQRSLVAQARAAVAQAQRAQAQDRNALSLLVGEPLSDADLPAPVLGADALTEVPVGLSSQVLLRRPDVVQAEQTLLAAQASVTAARAAFWPTITLTAQGGQASANLAGLFQGGHFAYTAVANAALQIFDAGRRQANVDSAVASRQIALAQYERAVQSAFRETADALAGVATWRDQVTAQAEQAAAARETSRLVELKARQGAASDLERQDAERSLLAAEQALVQVRLAEAGNRVALAKALGGPVAP